MKKHTILALLIFSFLRLSAQRSESIIRVGNVAFFEIKDTVENKMRFNIAAACNQLLLSYQSDETLPVYLIFKDYTPDTSHLNIYFDNIYGNSLDEVNDERTLEFYKPGIRIITCYNTEITLRLLDYGIGNINKLKNDRDNLVRSKSEDNQALRLKEVDVRKILAEVLNNKLTAILESFKSSTAVH